MAGQNGGSGGPNFIGVFGMWLLFLACGCVAVAAFAYLFWQLWKLKDFDFDCYDFTQYKSCERKLNLSIFLAVAFGVIAAGGAAWLCFP